MHELGLGPLNDHVVHALTQHSRRNRDGFKIDFHKQFPVRFRDRDISAMVPGDASWRRLSVPFRMLDRIQARLHGDRFRDTGVPLLLRNYGSLDPATLNRQRTLVHRALLLNELAQQAPAPAFRNLFSPVLVAIDSPTGAHIGLIQYDRTHNGRFAIHQLVAPPARDCRVRQLFGGDGEVATIPVDDRVYEELNRVYAALGRYFAPTPPPEHCLCLAETPTGHDVVVFDLARLQVLPGFEMMQYALLADYEVPTVVMTFAVDELFQPGSPHWNAALAAIRAAQYGVYANRPPSLGALETTMIYRDDVGSLSSAEARQIIGILLENGFLRKRGPDAYEADANPEVLRAAYAKQRLTWDELLSEEERPFAEAVLGFLRECRRRQAVAGHFNLLGLRGELSDLRADAVLAKLEGAGYITRVEPRPGESYFRAVRREDEAADVDALPSRQP